jgi:hypothetical protein
LDPAPEDADQVVADVAARIRRVRDDGVAAAEPAERDRGVRGVSADRPDVRLAATEEVDDLAPRGALDLVDEARALVVTVDPAFLVRVTFRVPRHEVGILHGAAGRRLRVPG